MFSVPQACRNNDHHPTTPQRQQQSTHQQSLPALTTSSPLKQIRPGLGAVSTKRSFQEKHTRCHIFPHRMCLHFRFSEALLPIVIFHDNGDSSLSAVCILVLLPALKKKNFFIYKVSEMKHNRGRLCRSTHLFNLNYRKLYT